MKQHIKAYTVRSDMPLIMDDDEISEVKTWSSQKINSVCTTSSDLTPVGVVLPMAGDIVPPGYLLCDGRAVSREEYSELFKIIKTIFGEGDGLTTFNLPDFRGRFIEGVPVGKNIGELIEAGLPNITGRVWGGQGVFQNGAGTDGKALSYDGYTSNTSYWNSGANNYNSITLDASRSDPIYGKSDTVQPPAITLNYIIKAVGVVSKQSYDLIDDNATVNNKTWSSEKVNNALTEYTKKDLLFSGRIAQSNYQVTLPHSIFDYDIIVFGHRRGDTSYWQSTTFCKEEIAELIDSNNQFMLMYGWSNETDYVGGYFSADGKTLNITDYRGVVIRFIKGFKFGN